MNTQEPAHMPSFFDFANGDDLAEKAHLFDQVLLRLSKEEVTSGLIGDAFDRLSILSDSDELTQKFKGNVWFYFTGYDDDPREIYQIPECVRFFRKLTESWPYWYHFLNNTPDQVRLLHQLLCDVTVQQVTPLQIRCSFSDPGQVKNIMMHLFGGLNHLYNIHNFKEEDAIQASQEVHYAIESFLFG